jgi:hypothetical protein
VIAFQQTFQRQRLELCGESRAGGGGGADIVSARSELTSNHLGALEVLVGMDVRRRESKVQPDC